MNCYRCLLLFFLLFSSLASAVESEKFYQQHCSQCHGKFREGGTGPSLADKEWVKVQPEKSALIRYISTGSPDTGMPKWRGVIDEDKISAIAELLLTIPEKKSSRLKTAKQPESFPELKNFRLPVGFTLSVYSDQVPNARGMAVAQSGIVFVASNKTGKIFALLDENKDFIADKIITVAENLNAPKGLTLLKGALFVSEVSRILRFDDIEKTYDKTPSYTVIKDDLPKERHHGEKIIKAGPDGKLYFEIGAPCNVCNKENEPHSKIYRMNPDGSEFEIYARGVRNSVGFAWHPQTQELWFTDNGRDHLGDNSPSDELNVAPKPGMHFGFPYCFSGVVEDPEFGKGRNCAEFTAPAANLGPHVAAVGLAFYEAQQFPEMYKHQLFIAEHGSWNRTQKIGYRVVLITLFNSKVVSETVFVDGFLQNESVVGRPVDIAFLPDGSMLISDDYGDRVFRVSYTGKKN